MKLGWASLRLGVMAASLATGASFASASVLYDNGAINGGINAWNISNGYAVENSFTLSSASTVTGVLFGLWSNPGDVISTVDWGISTTQGSFADNGTVPVTQGAFFGMDGFGYGYDIYTYSISIGPDSLAAGTYYLTLQNAAVTNSDSVFWDENDGPSSAMQTSTGVIGSEAFTVLGTTGAVPEPATWAMMALGFAGLGLSGYRRAKARGLAAAIV